MWRNTRRRAWRLRTIIRARRALALGAGGRGEVYRAGDGRLQRDVALKIIPEPFASDPERLARL
jgi:serine/threonine-protein kinase